MIFTDLITETYSAVTVNKARSGLTILGIVIGIASVIAMVAIGQGAQNSIQSSIQSIGSNLIMVRPGAQRGSLVSSGRGSAESLTEEDALAIETGVQNIEAVAGVVTKRSQITAPGTNTNTTVTGTSPAYMTVRNIQIDTGTFFTDAQVRSVDRVAVLGPTTRDDLFGAGSDAVGKTIRIGKDIFHVIGVTQSKGGSGFNNADDVIYVPLTTALHYLSGNNYLGEIDISAADQLSIAEVQTNVTNLLLQRHKINDPAQADFSILNQADIIATASSVTGTFTVLLAAIASISLLVGGIGIMNMMLTIVTERTREIGLRKAIGATEEDISFQFLAESILLTFVGGGVGILLGWLIAFVVSKVIGTAASVSLSSVLLAFGVSSGIGIVFGYYPAQRAAKLDPIEALRYE